MFLFGVTEIEGGFPHSEILGSKPVRGSPRLIAAYHVLHRLSAPRHPPDTLKTLDCSHNQGAARQRQIPTQSSALSRFPRCAGWKSLDRFEKTSFASNTSGSLAVKRSPRLRCSNRLVLEKSCSDPPLGAPRSPPNPAFRPNVFPLHDVRYRIRSASRLNFTSRSPPILPEAKASRETQEQTKQIFIGPPGGGES